MSDSLIIELTGECEDRLIAGLDLCPSQRVTGVSWYDNALVLEYEHDAAKPQKLPFNPSLMSGVILEWLGRSKGSNSRYAAPDWPEKPNIDGSVERGWKLLADDRKITVHPHWMIYHK